MEGFRDASLQAWTSVAPDWGELIADVDRLLGPAADWMLEEAALAPGDRVLELAGGPGTLSLLAAGAVGADGHVICTDFSEAMVEVARERIAREGPGNIECRVLDAESIDLADGTVDVVLCRMGYMLMGRPDQALAESARVLDQGGRLALAVWSDAASNPWAAVPMGAITEHLGAPPPPPGTPGLWALADEDHLRSLLSEAGLEVLAIEGVEGEARYGSPEDWLETTRRLAGPIRTLFAGLDEEGRRAIAERVVDAAGPYLQEDGSVLLPTRMLGASARKA